MPVFHVGATIKGKEGDFKGISGNSVGDGRMKSNLLEGKSAAVTFPCRLETGLFGWRVADEQELVGCVHELQLLEHQAVGKHPERCTSVAAVPVSRSSTLFGGSLTRWALLLANILL